MLRYLLLVIAVCAAFLRPDVVRAQADAVQIAVVGLGLDNGSNTFNLNLGTPLVANQRYQLLISGWNNAPTAQRVHNITFDVAITNGTLNSFTWRVPPPPVTTAINDSNLLNSIPGIDNLGQVSTDIFAFPQNTFPIPNTDPVQYWDFPGHSFPASPGAVQLGVLSFTAGATPSLLEINFDSNPGDDDFVTDNSHIGIDGLSHRINKGQGLLFQAKNPHPADTNKDFRISSTEALTYRATWRLGRTWPVAPSPITPSFYALVASAIWSQGEVYHTDLNFNCVVPNPTPQNCWKPGP